MDHEKKKVKNRFSGLKFCRFHVVHLFSIFVWFWFSLIVSDVGMKKLNAHKNPTVKQQP